MHQQLDEIKQIIDENGKISEEVKNQIKDENTQNYIQFNRNLEKNLR